MTDVPRLPPDLGVEYLTTQETARQLGIARSTVLHYIHTGQLAARKVPNSVWVVSREEVDRWTRERGSGI